MGKRLMWGKLLGVVASCFLFAAPTSAAETQSLVSSLENCRQEIATDGFLYRKHFNEWEFDPLTMTSYFTEIYKSPLRLLKRAWVQGAQVQVPIEINERSFENILVPTPFVQNLVMHFREALEQEYAKHIFFPDMGHGHFYLPTEEYKNFLQNSAGLSEPQKMQKLLTYKTLKIMYHTSEQLSRAPRNGQKSEYNKEWQWRNLVRHIVGQNSPRTSLQVYRDDSHFVKTGYTSVGGSFYFSANQAGCFRANLGDQTINFDISFKPYGVDPNDPPYESED